MEVTWPVTVGRHNNRIAGSTETTRLAGSRKARSDLQDNRWAPGEAIFGTLVLPSGDLAGTAGKGLRHWSFNRRIAQPSQALA